MALFQLEAFFFFYSCIQGPQVRLELRPLQQGQSLFTLIVRSINGATREPGFGDFLPFFSADPLKLLSGWTETNIFQVSPEMFDWDIHAAFLNRMDGIGLVMSGAWFLQTLTLRIEAK